MFSAARSAAGFAEKTRLDALEFVRIGNAAELLYGANDDCVNVAHGWQFPIAPPPEWGETGTTMQPISPWPARRSSRTRPCRQPQIGEHLAVNFDRRFFQAVHQDAIGDSEFARTGIDAGNPQPAEIAFFRAPIAVGILPAFMTACVATRIRCRGGRGILWLFPGLSCGVRAP